MADALDNAASQLAELLTNASNNKYGKKKGKTGKYNKTTGKLESALDELPPNKIWVRPNGSREAIQVFNIGKVNPQAVDIPIEYGKDSNGNLEIKNPDNQEVTDTLGSAAQVILGTSSPSQLLTRRSNIKDYKGQISKVIGTTIDVAPYSDTWGSFVGGSIDTSNSQPTVNPNGSPNYGVWEIVYQNFLTAELGITDNRIDVSGDLFAPTNFPKPTDIYTNRNKPPSYSRPILAVFCRYGATTLNNNDIIDMRTLFGFAPSPKDASIFYQNNITSTGELPIFFYNNSGVDRLIVSLGCTIYGTSTSGDVIIRPQINRSNILGVDPITTNNGAWIISPTFHNDIINKDDTNIPFLIEVWETGKFFNFIVDATGTNAGNISFNINYI